MWKLRLAVVELLTFALTGSAIAQPKEESRSVGVVNATSLAGTRGLQFGVVVEIDEQSMTIACPHPSEPESKPLKEYQLYPVRQLAEGKVLDKVAGSESYRWQDVKKGDTISAISAVDDNDKKRYCLAIRIHRRPGDVLPKGQITKHDETRYGMDSLLNDIDNRKDVDDAEIEKFFGRVTFKHPDRGTIEVVRPGGLPRDYQAKLDAIRAKKKDAELKATPPDKK